MLAWLRLTTCVWLSAVCSWYFLLQKYCNCCKRNWGCFFAYWTKEIIEKQQSFRNLLQIPRHILEDRSTLIYLAIVAPQICDNGRGEERFRIHLFLTFSEIPCKKNPCSGCEQWSTEWRTYWGGFAQWQGHKKFNREQFLNMMCMFYRNIEEEEGLCFWAYNLQFH